MVESVDEDEKGRKIVSTLGGDQEVWFLSENGVYEDEAARRNLPTSSGAKETWFLSENGLF